MKADDLIAFITEEAHHRLINDKWSKTAESALATLSKNPKAGKQHNHRGKEKSVPDAVMSLPIRYSPMAFYFQFSIIFLTPLIYLGCNKDQRR